MMVWVPAFTVTAVAFVLITGANDGATLIGLVVSTGVAKSTGACRGGCFPR